MKLTDIQKARLIRCQHCALLVDIGDGLMTCDDNGHNCWGNKYCTNWDDTKMANAEAFLPEITLPKHKELFTREEEAL